MGSDHIDVEFVDATPGDGVNNALALRDEKTAELSTEQDAPRGYAADEMLAKLREWEKFKSLAVRDNAWIEIPGIPGKYLPADEVYRIAPAVGIKWEIISLNEHGQKGVRCEMVDFLTYEKKKVTKRKRDKRTGEWSEYETEVSDTTKPIISKTMRYSVTIRAADRFERFVDVEGSFDALEMPKSDYHARQQALTRARRRATLILVGGVDKDVAEEMRAGLKHARDAKTQQGRALPSTQQLMQRARELGVCTDGPTFCAWVKVHAGIEQAATGWTPTPDHKRAIVAALDAIGEPKAAPASSDADVQGNLFPTLQRMMFALAKEQGIPDAQRHELLRRRYARDSSNDLTLEQLRDFIAFLKGEVT